MRVKFVIKYKLKIKEYDPQEDLYVELGEVWQKATQHVCLSAINKGST